MKEDNNIEFMITQIRSMGYTLTSLADKMGTSKQNLNGKLKSPSYPTLVEISEALEIPLWRLFAPQNIADTNGELIAMIKKENRFWFASSTDELRKIADDIDNQTKGQQSRDGVKGVNK